MKAVIAGGGIGGLCAALCFERAGWEVCVLEQAASLDDVGGGIQISPNAMTVLKALGVTDGLAASRVAPQRLAMRRGVSGRPIFSIPLSSIAEARWGAPYWHLHRADLIAALCETLSHRAPGALRLGARVTRYAQSGGAADAILDDGSRIAADVLIGADGIHSVIRAQMLGPDKPRFTGNVAWRAVVPVARLGADAPSADACVWAGPGRHAVTYRLRGGELANFVGIVEQDGWQGEGWREQGRIDDLRAAFAGWHRVITTLIDNTDQVYRWALLDRAPLPRWSDGRVALLGDAAHPMLPSLAQGAVQAIEDGWVMAHCAGRGDDIAGALRRYFDCRVTRTSRIQARALQNLRLFHRRTTLGAALSHSVLGMAARIAPNAVHARQDWIYGHDVTVDAIPSPPRSRAKAVAEPRPDGRV